MPFPSSFIATHALSRDTYFGSTIQPPTCHLPLLLGSQDILADPDALEEGGVVRLIKRLINQLKSKVHDLSWTLLYTFPKRSSSEPSGTVVPIVGRSIRGRELTGLQGSLTEWVVV